MKQLKIISLVFVLLISVISVNASTINTLSDNSTIRALTVTSTQSETVYVKLPKSATVLSASLDLSGYSVIANLSDGFNFSDQFSGGLTDIKTNGSDFWILVNSIGFGSIYWLNSSKNILREYSLNGSNIQSGDLYGLDTNGTDMWVNVNNADLISDDWVIHLNSSGANMSSSSFFVGSSGADSANGIATNGSDFWILDIFDNFVYHFDSLGNNMSDGFSVNFSANSIDGSNLLRRLATDNYGTEFWAVDRINNFVYHFDSFGNNMSDGFDVSSYGAGVANGIARYNSDFWIIDGADDFVYHFGPSYLNNPNLDIGIVDSVYEWEYTGDFALLSQVSDFSSSMNYFLATCIPDNNGDCLVPLMFNSGSTGILQISNINVSYINTPICTPELQTPLGLAWDGNDFYYANEVAKKVYKVSTDGTILGSFTGPGGEKVHGIAWDGTYLWLVGYPSGNLYKINVNQALIDGNTNNAVISTLNSINSYTEAMAYGDNSLWVSFANVNQINQIDPTTGNVISNFEYDPQINARRPEGCTWKNNHLVCSFGPTNTLIDEIDINQAIIDGNIYNSITKSSDIIGTERAAGVAWNGTAMWYSNLTDGCIYSFTDLPPTIDSVSPTTLPSSINEGDTISFTQSSSDSDGDPLIYSWLLDNTQVATTQNYDYITDYTSAGNHNVTLVVSDGSFSTSQQWLLTVNNVNQLPILNQINNITINENELLTMTPTAIDLDNDTLTYTYSSPLNSNGQWQTDYSSAGTYNATVTVSDGISSDTQIVIITVNDVQQDTGSSGGGGGGGGSGGGSSSGTLINIKEELKDTTLEVREGTTIKYTIDGIEYSIKIYDTTNDYIIIEYNGQKITINKDSIGKIDLGDKYLIVSYDDLLIGKVVISLDLEEKEEVNEEPTEIPIETGDKDKGHGNEEDFFDEDNPAEPQGQGLSAITGNAVKSVGNGINAVGETIKESFVKIIEFFKNLFS